MTNIKVVHDIGDIVEHSFNERKFMVVGYNYVKDRGMQYICLQSDSNDFAYMLECELKKSKQKNIGFSIKK